MSSERFNPESGMDAIMAAKAPGGYAAGRNADHDADPLAMARAIVEDTSVNLFLTGKAGTGKTTFLRSLTNGASKRLVVLAPTGVAAINAGGNTIHSFFQLDFAPWLPGVKRTGAGAGRGHRFSKSKLSLIKTLDLLVIDEVSMVRPDVLDAVDEVLRRIRASVKPFGGVQLLLIGDLRQLAPVVPEQEWALLGQYYSSPYFFESRALKQAGFLMVELTKVFRQSDPLFIEILNRIRDNTADSTILAELNRRAHPSLMPAEGADEGYIRLTTHNYRADAINSHRLAAIQEPAVEFVAEIKGKFPESSYPADKVLTLKKGAQVMFIKNDPSGNQEYYNGLIGDITDISGDEVSVLPRGGEVEIKVGKVTWENTRYELSPEGEIREETEGSFSQVPLRTAWAITIHKSQGLTFDKAIVDAARSFAPGQTYVALSRCRSLEGLVLDSPLPMSSIMTDPTVNDFISTHPRMAGDPAQLDGFRDSYFGELLYEMFNFRQLDDSFDAYYRACAAAMPRLFPAFMAELDSLSARLRTEIMDVASKLYVFFGRALPHRKEPEAWRIIMRKIKGGSDYFMQKLEELRRIVDSTPTDLDNKALLKRVVQNKQALLETVGLHLAIFATFSGQDFTPNEYLTAKTKYVAAGMKTPPKRMRSSLAGGSAIKKAPAEYVENPDLYHALVEWRRKRAGNLPVYMVLGNKALMSIAKEMPTSEFELLSIYGVSKAKCGRYGQEIIDIVRQFDK